MTNYNEAKPRGLAAKGLLPVIANNERLVGLSIWTDPRVLPSLQELVLYNCRWHPLRSSKQMVLKDDRAQSFDASGILSNIKGLYLVIYATESRPGFLAADSQLLENNPSGLSCFSREV